MTGDDQVSAAWKAHRPYLVDLAFRILGDIGAAEDAVQEAFARLVLARIDDIEDQRGWLIVVTSRLCLDQIRSAHSRRERAEDAQAMEVHVRGAGSVDPADRVTLDDNVRLALLVVLERLTPAERVVFVLHDIFAMPFDVIADTVGRTTQACRQLAHRARRKIDDAGAARSAEVDPAQHRMVTERFIAACANGSLSELLAVLDPAVAGEIDLRPGLVVTGSARVARNLLLFWGGPPTTLVTQPVGGRVSLLAFVGRELRGLLTLTVDEGRITKIHVIADPSALGFLRRQLPVTR